MIELDTPEGPIYIDPHAVIALGPIIDNSAVMDVPVVRSLMLQGGHSVLILASPENHQAIRERMSQAT